ncbi:copper resistance CopC family protein [Longimicrobium sp.]|uniref:copper resistance CopC family protein n=1 Tax=Longimicrobium sp. TaxID=2029185 RepID=UPI002C42CA04|nr:copper resistance CopC family protein [Longimicrobium sp.]HSU16913.1 copper resistance CopC family protein [Longimicrobium sp.]
MRRISMFVAAAVIAAGAVAARPLATRAEAEAAFHLRLVRSTPAEDAALPPGPCHIELWFTEAPELRVTSLHLTGANGRQVPLTALSAHHPRGENPSVAANTRGRLTPGRYALAWRTMAHDGHVMRGTINFTVAAR